MNVAIIGSGGREHALAAAYSKSKKVSKIFVFPGNDLISVGNKKILTFPKIPMTNFEKILQVCKKNKVSIIDVAQDDVLAAGFVDKFIQAGIQSFGPTQKASEIEWSKEWARSFMIKYKLPIPTYKTFSNQNNAINYINKMPEQTLYIKASGLCGGKGAIRAETRREAIDAINSMRSFGKAGETFLIEECLVGEEFSLFAICEGLSYSITKIAQDHKTVFNKDKGDNTGGMGSVAPSGLLSKKQISEIEKSVIQPFLQGMIKEQRTYTGILYVGGMLTKKGVKIIEFNARWGDPEAEVIIPSIQTDYLSIVEAVINKNLKKKKILYDKKVRVSIAGCSAGYPSYYTNVKGKEIFGLQDAAKLPGITIFGAGIQRKGKRLFANGGRIFHLVAEGKNITEARKRAYEAISMIFIEGNNLHYRTDIGWRDIGRLHQ
jgi:phosphoribosylamine--glycine ligase